MAEKRRSKEQQQLYWIYHDAKRRCLNPKHHAFLRYGGRGIQFKFTSFAEWEEHIGPRPLGYEQDRINNDGHYEPGNVRWVTLSTQNKNKRIARNNTSGVKGVSYITTKNMWTARCNEQGNGKRRYLYYGKSYEEACSARQEWEKTYTTISTRG